MVSISCNRRLSLVASSSFLSRVMDKVTSSSSSAYLQSERDLSITGMYITIRQHLHVPPRKVGELNQLLYRRRLVCFDPLQRAVSPLLHQLAVRIERLHFIDVHG